MRIVLFGPVWPWRGGVPHFSAALANALTSAGHEVRLVNFEKLFPKFLFPGKSQIDDSPAAQRIESERVFVGWKPRAWKKTARVIEQFEPDIVLASWWMPTFGPGYRGVYRALSPEYRARWSYLIHDVVSHERRPGDVWLARMALRTGKKFLVLSRAEGERLQKLVPEVSGDQILYAMHPPFGQYRKFSGTVEEAKRQMGVRAKNVLLFFGFVRKYKGLDLLIAAIPEILKAQPDTELLICGPFHESRARYEKEMEKLGVKDQVVIHERYFSGDGVGVCFAAAEAVVLPYRSATQSGVIPTALALETPVIATRAGGLDEAMADDRIGVVIEKAEPQAVAQAVKKFLAAGGRAVFEEGMKTASRMQDWPALVKRIEQCAE